MMSPRHHVSTMDVVVVQAAEEEQEEEGSPPMVVSIPGGAEEIQSELSCR